MKVVVDSSVFISAYKNGDVFKRISDRWEAEFFSTSAVRRELSLLAGSHGPRGMAARLGLKLMEHMRVLDVEGKADDSLLKAASQINGVLATSDVELSRRALARRIPVIFINKGGNPKLLGW